jgi:hypothetical protein
MKGIIKGLVICLSISFGVTTAQAAMTDAEETAISSGNPRDCSLFVDAMKKAACTDFNKALVDCKIAGYRVGKELKACMVKKGKVKR